MKNFKILINTLSLGKHKAYPATLRQNSGVKQGSPQAHTKCPLFLPFSPKPSPVCFVRPSLVLESLSSGGFSLSL